jgi:hypothetical protein
MPFAYDISIQKKVKVLNPRIEVIGGRYYIKGISPITGNNISTIISKKDAEKYLGKSKR